MRYRLSQNGENVSAENDDHQMLAQGSAFTHVGRVRTNNEDSIGLWAFDRFLVGLVADGMGGAAGGEEASRLTVETIQKEFIERYPEPEVWRSLTNKDIAEQMRQTLVKANHLVLDKAANNHQLHGMGTTATMVMLRDRTAIFAHIGDSRAYVVHTTQRIDQITSDHSFVEALVVSGHLTPEQAAVHPMKNVLYRALGQKSDSELEIDIYTQELAMGDRLVLCSDGLTRHLKDQEIAAIAVQNDSPKDIAKALIELANNRGGEDNISAVVLMIDKKA